MNATRPTAWLALAGLLAWASAAGEAARLELNLAEVAGPGIVARGITVAGLTGPNRQAGRLSIARLDLGEGMIVTGLGVDCPQMVFTLREIRCESGSLSGDFPLAGPQLASVTWRWNRPRSRIEVAVDGLAIAGGSIRFTADIEGGAGTYRVEGRGLEADELPALLSEVTGLGIGGAFTGRFDADLEAAVRGPSVTVTGKAVATGLTGSNEAGTLAFENLGLVLSAVRSASGEVALNLDTETGQLYAEPVFLDFSVRPASLTARLETGGEHPVLRRAALNLGPALSADARGSLAWTGQKAEGTLDLDFESADAGALYEALLKPFVYATPMDDLDASGRLTGSARLAGDGLELMAIDLDGVGLTDRQQRYAFTDLRGRITWPGDPAGPGNPSYLAWAGGALYGLALGPAAAAFSVGPGHLRLLEATRFPVLDGALRLSRLEIAGTSDEDASAAIEAELEPISLQRLTTTLGWPPFAGELSGSLPLLRYENGEAIVGGTLAASVFDGEITIDHLRLVEPLGDLPRLFADARIRNLDLETLTRAFSFGRITGRLDGDVEGLQMIAWSPAAFDARLYSSPGSKDRRRISQRAVENISSIGGSGAAAALSGTFLRFFEDFAYREIGIRCRLQQGICHMGGAGPAESGYYLVQGRGLPRIDVVGYAEEVDWPRLVAQLKSVSLEGDLRVE